MVKSTLGATSNNLELSDIFFEELRRLEFSRLENDNHTYLDYTGGALYPQSLLDLSHQMLSDSIFGNPHSHSPASIRSTDHVESSRNAVLEYFNAVNDYICVFTANATGALSIIGECFPFDSQSHFLLLADNHNSVNGIREYCKSNQGTFDYVPIRYQDLEIEPQVLFQYLEKYPEKENKLFAYPAQSNVSGVKHSLDWIGQAQNYGWDVLLDAAAFVPTSELNLDIVKPDFVTASFYKMFGYPTGIGCLLIKKDKFSKLNKRTFTGGNVKFVSVNEPKFFLVENHEKFENGTINYLNIPLVKHGLDFISKIGIQKINNRISKLTEWLLANLSNQFHDNGNPILKLFGTTEIAKRGGTIIMNFFDKNGFMYPFEFIEQEAADNNISLRTGCFCNPGIDEINSCITNQDLSKYYSISDDCEYQEMLQIIGKMRGAVRISVGIPTIENDLLKFMEFVQSFKNKSFELTMHKS